MIENRGPVSLGPLFPALLVALAASPAVAQAPVQFDVSSVFNADVIVNTDPDPPTPFDETNDFVDQGSFALLTQSGAAVNCSTPVGLPDNGFFPANASHPDVQLAYNDANSGLNGRRSPSIESYSFIVPANNYTDVHVFFTSGEGDAAADVTLTYDTGAPSVGPISVPDWFSDPVPPTYALFDGGDRMPPTAPFNCGDDDTVAIFGFNIGADPGRLLQSVTIARTDSTGAVLNLFGATGELVVPVELQGFTVE